MSLTQKYLRFFSKAKNLRGSLTQKTLTYFSNTKNLGISLKHKHIRISVTQKKI